MARRLKPPKADAPYPAGWEPFLAAINADLDDDTARLVFADWLQENGDEPRAQFIRLQIELHRVHPEWENRAVREPLFTAAQLATYDRQRQLRHTNFARWVAGFPAWSKSSTWAVRRGFAYFFAPTALQWLKDGDRVRARPRSRSWPSPTPTRARQPVAEVARRARDRRRTEPRPPGPRRRRGAGSRQLAGARFARVAVAGQTRELGDCPERRRGGRHQPATRPPSCAVRYFQLRRRRRGARLARAPWIELERLGLACTALGPKPFADLIASPQVEGLRALDLQGNGVGDRGVRALVRSKLVGLEELNLQYNGLTAESARLLATWPGLRSVRVLELAGAKFGTAGAPTCWRANTSRA